VRSWNFKLDNETETSVAENNRFLAHMALLISRVTHSCRKRDMVPWPVKKRVKIKIPLSRACDEYLRHIEEFIERSHFKRINLFYAQRGTRPSAASLQRRLEWRPWWIPQA